VAVCAGLTEWVAEGEALRDTVGATAGEALPDGLAELPAGLGEAGEVPDGALREADGLADPVVPAPLPAADEFVALPAAPPVSGEGELDAGWLAVPLYRPDDVADTVPVDGEKTGGIGEDGPDVQADTNADMRTVTVTQPAAVSLALLTFMRPPCIPCMQRR
jgi:hypothetical protein